MRPAHPPIRWHPRVPQDKIRRLYELDARGMVDEVLLEDVGIALYLRSQSILLVAEHRVECPCCNHVFATGWHWDKRHETMPIRCPACNAWETTGRGYRESFQHDALAAGNCLPAFQEYVARYPAAATPRERMLRIDRLIHQFHFALKRTADGGWERREDRPHAVNGANLIEGSHDQVVAFLNALTYGERSTPEVRETYASWRPLAETVMTVRGSRGRKQESGRANAREE